MFTREFEPIAAKPGAPELEAGASVERAFPLFAGGAEVLAIRRADGMIAGGLTMRRAMQALAQG